CLAYELTYLRPIENGKILAGFHHAGQLLLCLSRKLVTEIEPFPERDIRRPAEHQGPAEARPTADTDCREVDRSSLWIDPGWRRKGGSVRRLAGGLADRVFPSPCGYVGSFVVLGPNRHPRSQQRGRHGSKDDCASQHIRARLYRSAIRTG